ncbi:MAG: AsmA family protein [Candidatus Aureabacteria bacterium]|nr:AsmA family protein [Candidatus Auribacterota bacterium]
MKKRTLIIGSFLVIFLSILFFKNTILKSIIINGAELITGAPVEMKGFSFRFFQQKIRIKDFWMGNPEGFPEEDLVVIPLIEVDFVRSALLKKRIHLKKLVIDIEQVALVKSRDGQLNVDALSFVKAAQDKEEEKDEEKKPSSEIPMQIDQLTLSIGKVIYKDYSEGENPVIKVYEINIQEKSYTNIRSAETLAALVLTEAMKPTAIKGAAIYGAATVLGVGLLPVGAAAVLIKKDSASAYFVEDFEHVYSAAITVLKTMGEVSEQNRQEGVIRGKASGCKVTIEISADYDKTGITVSARKMLLPQPEIAGGILHEISRLLEKNPQD